jgi:hypothetical protein
MVLGAGTSACESAEGLGVYASDIETSVSATAKSLTQHYTLHTLVCAVHAVINSPKHTCVMRVGGVMSTMTPPDSSCSTLTACEPLRSRSGRPRGLAAV